VTAAARPPTVPGLTGLTVLARGGYATVYRAVQESIGRDVAVKVENRTLESDRDRQRFMREARAAGRMSSHPHVVDLFDAGVTTDGHPYLIMELCNGSYAERMRSAPLTPEEAREVGYKIADALADGHSLGVLHRDVKPANILFSHFGEPALADFGLAILAEWRDISITLDVLTPAYAPPEAFRQAHPSPSGDVYALCATLYALMRGRPPRWRDDRTPSLVSLVDMFAERVPDVPGVPGEMMALLRAGMANDEAARPTAIDLRDALQGMRFPGTPGVLIPPLGSPPVGPGPFGAGPGPGSFGAGAGSAGAGSAGPDEITVPHVDELTVPRGVLSPTPADGSPGKGPLAPGSGDRDPGGSGLAGSGSAGSSSGESGSAGPGSGQSGLAGSGVGGSGSAGSGSGRSGLGGSGMDGSGSAGSGSGVPSSDGSGSGFEAAGIPVPRDSGSGSGSGGSASGSGSDGGAPLAFLPGPRSAVVGSFVPSPTPMGPSRRLLIWSLAVCGCALVAIVAVSVAYARAGAPDRQVFRTPAAVSTHVAGSPTAGPQPSTRPTAAPSPSAVIPVAGNCGPVAPSGVTCPINPDCYDSTKHLVACSGTHTWEAFAVGQLPAGVPSTKTGHDPQVLEACSRITLLAVAPQTAAQLWQVDVLAPTGSSRTYRCLAGRGPNALVGSQLAHR
jgi:tRNA A-37 threonylcarbamoyl transferase component Bud32